FSSFRPPPISTLFPYTTLFRSTGELLIVLALLLVVASASQVRTALLGAVCVLMAANRPPDALIAGAVVLFIFWSRGRYAAMSTRSEEHTSELQSQSNLVCRLLL